MFHRLRTRAQRSWFNRQTRGILETAPLEIKDAQWSIVSMVGNDDVQMYLLGMKSFYSRLGAGKLIAIVSKTMPVESRTLLNRHFPGIRYVTLQEIDTGRCQHGGTWERLIFLLDLSQQFDCDVLAFGANVAEVRQSIENNVSFTLGNAGRPIETMSSIAIDAREMKSDYIGIVAERVFDKYPDAERTRYVRASSAFAGFARGGFAKSKIEQFHDFMNDMLGRRWNEWGSEQCGSNFAVANSAEAIVLPYPKYANFWPGLKREGSSLLHFLGTYRYLDGYYASLARAEISRLAKL
jgi:hypothetical protein